MRRLIGKAALAVWLIAGSLPAMAQGADNGPSTEALKAIPESPSGRPMEADWSYGPEAPNGQLGAEPGPYLVSHWGNIVVRGRREGDRVAAALSILHCGAKDNPATDITMIGMPDQKLCGSVEQLTPGQTNIVSGDGFNLYGTSQGWTVVDFAQKVGGAVLHSGLEPAGPEAKGGWGITHFGAVYHDENGKHVFYAPGETVDLGHGVTFVVKNAMDEQELQAYVVTAGMRSFSDTPKPVIAKPVPWAGLAIILGVPLALIAGLIFGIRHWIRRRRGLAPAPASAPFNPADIPVGTRVADVVKADGAAAAVPPKPSDGAAWWRAQPPAKRRAIIIGTAFVLLLVALFVTLRPAEPDETALLRKLVASAGAATAPSALGMTLNEEPLPTAARAGEGQPTPAEGHVGRFAVYRPANAKLLFDTFTTPVATDAALAAIHDHGPQEVLLLPADSGSATSFAEPMAARGSLALNFECRRTAAYLYCMTRPKRTAMLLTVRAPNDTDLTIDGVNDAKTVVATEAQQAIDGLNTAGIGGQRGS